MSCDSVASAIYANANAMLMCTTIVFATPTSERAATSGAGDGQSVTEQEIQHLILCRTVQPWGTLLAPPDPLEWEGLRRKRLFTRPTASAILALSKCYMGVAPQNESQYLCHSHSCCSATRAE